MGISKSPDESWDSRKTVFPKTPPAPLPSADEDPPVDEDEEPTEPADEE